MVGGRGAGRRLQEAVVEDAQGDHGEEDAEHALHGPSARAPTPIGLVSVSRGTQIRTPGTGPQTRLAAGEVQRGVAGDPVQPRLQRQRQRARRSARAWALMKRLLERVLGRGGARYRRQ